MVPSRVAVAVDEMGWRWCGLILHVIVIIDVVNAIVWVVVVQDVLTVIRAIVAARVPVADVAAVQIDLAQPVVGVVGEGLVLLELVQNISSTRLIDGVIVTRLAI